MDLSVLHRERGEKASTYKLDGDLLAVEQVRALKDDAKGALSDLLPHPVVHPHNVG